MTRIDNLLEIAKALPQDPGVYRYYNQEADIIYVGKAKNLRKRVTSYFLKSTQHNNKTKRLISKIASLSYDIVDTEFDALLLENTLIKKHQPKYNILLKDDKTYPYVTITKERFPRLEISRIINRKKAEYFGPYSNGKARKNLEEVLRNTFHFRTCNYDLSEANITAKKYSVCMDYHIGKCKGPCEGLEKEEDYLQEVNNAREILRGKFNPAKQYLTEEMDKYSKKLEFEKAELTKNKLESLSHSETKSTVANPNLGNMEVYTYIYDSNKLFVNYLKIANGVINAITNYIIKNVEEETIENSISQYVFNNRLKHPFENKEILTNKAFTYPDDRLTIIEPKMGDKKKLIDLSIKNLFQYKLEKSTTNSGKETSHRILETLKSDLRMTELPKHIECFDNSNIQGTNPVASMVCFKMGKPSKKDYRHYNIKTIVGPDDFGSMKEIVERRYTRLKNENQPFPQLIIIDGGKGQLNAAKEILKELGIYNKVALIGIAKRLEEIYFPEDKDPVLINKKSESLKLIQKLRNEAHRFAITFHRDQRSRSFIRSKLSQIEGIGPKTEQELLKKFKSVKNIKQASIDDISLIVGKSKAKIIKDTLNNN